MKEGHVVITPAFWKTVSVADMMGIHERGGYLDAEQCARLWRMTDRQDTPPERLQILVKREDVERLWPLKPK